MKVANRIIIKPLISEKSLFEAKNGKYSFVVEKSANKHEIASAVEFLFGVNVKYVATNITKEIKVRNTRLGRSKTDLTYKKARVQLASGEKIDLFEADTK